MEKITYFTSTLNTHYSLFVTKGQSPGEAEVNFLEHAKRLEMYGIALHPGKDSQGRGIQLGVTCIGLVVFQNAVKMNTFSWSKIVKISFKRKQFFIQLRKESTESFDTLLGFNLASYRSCKNLWKSAVEHHSFFRLHAPHATPAASAASTATSGLRGRSPNTKKFLTLNLGSKFRYSGRGTEFKSSITPEGTLKPENFDKVDLSRTSALRKTLPLHLEPSATSINTVEAISGGQNDTSKKVPRLASPETSSIGSSVHSNGGLKAKANSAASVPKRGQQQPTSDLEVTPTNSHQSLAHRAIESFNNKVQSLSSKLPKKAWQDEPTSDDEGSFFLELH